MKDDTTWKISSGPSFIRCKDAIVEVSQIVAIKKVNTCLAKEPSRYGHKIHIVLCKGETLSLDFSQDDEAHSAEPRDRAFDDIWRALTGKVAR